MKIKKSNILKSVAGIALASAMFASQLAVPQSSVLDGVLVSENIVSAAAKTVDDCDFVYDAKDYVIGGEDPDNKDQLIIDISDIPAGSVIEEVLVEVATGSEDATAMIAIGCHVKGYNEDDWFSASGQDAGDSLIFSYPVPEEAGSVYGTDYTELFVQHWWGTVDTVTVKKVGINIAGGAGSAVAGDFDGDKKIKAPDLVMFAQYMVGEISSEYFDVVADYNGDGTANVVDFIMMKNKLTKNLGNSGITDNGQTAIEFVENISIGWNLGNTLESTCDWIDNPTPAQFETAWGNPITTKAMIDAVKDAGFNTVRVPVSWGQKMDENYTVSAEWMDRVNEVVDYVIDNDMYCILNVHHDNDWLVPTYEKYDGAVEQLTALWAQISERFKNYDEKLIFETMNEPRLVGTDLEWTGGNAEARDCINKFNAAALDTIRESGGNNALRYVMLPTYAASASTTTLGDFVVPDDPRAIVSIHAYSPYFFALANNDVPGSTDKWGTDADKAQLKQEMKMIYDKFIANDIAVIIGEFGAMNKENTEARTAWAEYYIATAKSFRIRCVWWDNNLVKGTGERFGLIDRQSLEAPYPEVLEALFKGLNS